MKHIFIIFIIFLSINADSQQVLPAEVLKKMEIMEVDFIDPVDSRYSINIPKKKKRKKPLQDYDFEVKKKDRVVWVQLIPEEANSLITFPHLEFHRLLTHIASNKGESNIYIYDISMDKGVDWMSEARFTPKDNLTDYDYGTAKVYYKEGKGMIVVLYFDKKIQARFEPYVGFRIDDKL